MEELRDIFLRSDWVEEAYFEELLFEKSVEVISPVVVGILSSQSSHKDRFRLVEEISLVSILFYGDPGVIEVFEDLNAYGWELFKALVPFYERREQNLAVSNL